MGGFKFALCFSVCLFYIHLKTAERVGLKFCKRTEEVCPEHSVSLFGDFGPSGSIRGHENVPWRRYCVSVALANLLSLHCHRSCRRLN